MDQIWAGNLRTKKTEKEESENDYSGNGNLKEDNPEQEQSEKW